MAPYSTELSINCIMKTICSLYWLLNNLNSFISVKTAELEGANLIWILFQNCMDFIFSLYIDNIVIVVNKWKIRVVVAGKLTKNSLY